MEEQWRGMESEILVWLGDGDHNFSCIMDTCIRVMARLVLVSLPLDSMDDSFSLTLSNGRTMVGNVSMEDIMKKACETGRARWAEEQGMDASREHLLQAIAEIQHVLGQEPDYEDLLEMGRKLSGYLERRVSLDWRIKC